MRQRSGASWIVVGTLAVIGGFWLTIFTSKALLLNSEWIPLSAHFIGALVAGAMMVAHAALRPWREPLIAGAAAIGVFVLLYIVLWEPWGTWGAARSAHPWLMSLALAGVSAAGALCGAMIARRITTTAPGTVKIVLLSALTIIGCAVTIMHFLIGVGFETEVRGWLVLVVLLAIVLGGFLTQLMVPVYRPWASGSGGIVMGLIVMGQTGVTRAALSAVVSSLVTGAIGAIGARLARRWVNRPEEAALDPLPAARLH